MDATLAPSLDELQRYVYKFRSLAPGSAEFAKRVITGRELYFSCPLHLNDPFEGYFAFDRSMFPKLLPELGHVVAGKLAQMNPDAGHAAPEKIPDRELLHQIETLRLKLRDEFLANVGVVSLSKRYDSSLMWSNYADSHKGVCFELDLNNCGDGDWVPVPVKYCDDCLVTKFGDFEAMSGAITASMYHKSVDWAYEQEYRFIRLSGPGPAQFPAGMLSGVILGSRIDPQMGQDILQLLKSFPSSVRIGMAMRDPYSYRVRVIDVGDSQSGIVSDVEKATLWRAHG